LRDNAQAARMFTGEACGLCVDRQWDYMSKGLHRP
jgi:hypothetical protein